MALWGKANQMQAQSNKWKMIRVILPGALLLAICTAATAYFPKGARTVWQVVSVVLLAVVLAGLVVYRDAQLSSVACSNDRQGELVCTAPASGT